MHLQDYDLITNFKTTEQPLIEIAVNAAELKHTFIGPAFNVLGEVISEDEYKGLYVEKNFHESQKKQIELHFTAYSIAKQMLTS